MDGLFTSAGMSLDTTRYELRRSASGADVVCAKSEVAWRSAAAAAPPASSRAAEGIAATFAQMAITGGAAVAPAVAAAASARGGLAASPAAPKQYKVSELSLEERFASVRAVGEECIQVRDGVCVTL